MLKWTFVLNPDSDNIETDEPVGWTDAEFALSRDHKVHGISILFGMQSVRFSGDAADFLMSKKQSDGVDANVEYLIRAVCDDTGDDVVEFEEKFKLDFGQYSDTCGDECFVEIGIEEISCINKFNTNYDQKIDIDKTESMDGSALAALDKLNFELMLPPKTIVKVIDGSVAANGETISSGSEAFTADFHFQVRPSYNIERANAIATGQLFPASNYYLDRDGFDGAISPQLLLEDDDRCFQDGISVVGRMKGRLKNTSFATITNNINIEYLKVIVYYGLYGVTAIPVFEEIIVMPGDLARGDELEFDVDFNAAGIPLQNGEGIWALVDFEGHPTNELNPVTFEFEFDTETFITITANQKCPPTPARVTMVHELLSRAIQAATDNCADIRSNYYGRTDSQPTAYLNDGCGAMRTLTSGLKIRNANDANFFLSLKDAFAGLIAIDNIGHGFEKDPGTGTIYIRVESAEYFYQDVEILKLDHINQVKTKIAASELFNIIKIGFEKWETQTVNSLDEVHSNREYRPSLQNVTGTRDLICRFIAASYAIELCRTQNFITTGAADNKYDNDTFIICVRRTNCVTLAAISFTNVFGYPAIAVPAGTATIEVGKQITITGTENNNNTFTVVEINPLWAGWLVKVAEPVTNEDIPNGNVRICGVDDVDGLVEVDQGNIINAANIVDPETIYNFPISPIRNLMRHFKTLAGIFPDHTTHEFIFQAGTGNITAVGEQSDPDCKIENKPMAENENISVDDFAAPSDARPIFRPEIVSFEYPLSIADFYALRANPYGFISYRCNANQSFSKGYLFNLKYQLTSGMASFELRNKY